MEDHIIKLKSLKLTNFRNIESARIEPSEQPIIMLYGENGAGKTTILEAISLLSPGYGMHRNKLSNHIKHDQNDWSLYGEISNKSELHTAGMSYKKGKRHLKINAEIVKSQSELSNLGNVLWFTPKMDRLFMDSTTHRREFLDRLVFGYFPDHAHNLNRYKYHLKSRLKLLKEGGPSDWIDIEEKQVSSFALLISKARNKYLETLKPYLKPVNLKLTGSFEDLESKTGALIRSKFNENRTRDKKFASNHFGPHRSNVEGVLKPENIPLNKLSTGQHKRAILEILLANSRLIHKKTGETPIVLLDEMSAHLDEKTRNKFFNDLLELNSQIWVTGTEKLTLPQNKNIQYIKVINATFQKDDI